MISWHSQIFPKLCTKVLEHIAVIISTVVIFCHEMMSWVRPCSPFCHDTFMLNVSAALMPELDVIVLHCRTNKHMAALIKGSDKLQSIWFHWSDGYETDLSVLGSQCPSLMYNCCYLHAPAVVDPWLYYLFCFISHKSLPFLCYCPSFQAVMWMLGEGRGMVETVYKINQFFPSKLPQYQDRCVSVKLVSKVCVFLNLWNSLLWSYSVDLINSFKGNDFI